MLLQARGIILLTAVQRDIEIYEYTPMQVKQAVVGYGKAEKHQVQEMVKNILRLDAITQARRHCGRGGSRDMPRTFQRVAAFEAHCKGCGKRRRDGKNIPQE